MDGRKLYHFSTTFSERSQESQRSTGGLPAHRGKTVKEFLREGASRRLHLEQLPGYAPDLNPDEGVWNYLKNVEMKNLCCQGLDHLKTELRKAKERLRHKTQIIKSFFREVGLV